MGDGAGIGPSSLPWSGTASLGKCRRSHLKYQSPGQTDQCQFLSIPHFVSHSCAAMTLFSEQGMTLARTRLSLWRVLVR